VEEEEPPLNPVPWWALSPGPLTISIYTIMAFYGAYRFNKTSKLLGAMDWVRCTYKCAFIVGLVVLPFDLIWTVDEALVFGHLYPGDLAELFPLFNMKLAVWILCWIESYKFFGDKGPLEKRNLMFMIVFVFYLTAHFWLAPDPSWTDYTYAIRHGYDNVLLSWLFGPVGKSLQVGVYYGIWKKNV